MIRPASQQWIIRGTLAATALGLTIAACVTHEHPRPQCGELSDGGPARIEPPEALVFEAGTDAQAPTALGIEDDPGPTCTNCQQGDDYEIMRVVDFEEGYAPAWIDYGEPGAWVEPKGIGAACGVNVPAPYFGLQAVDLRSLPGGARCDSHYALHLEGGPFKTWGGGYATQFMSVRGQQYISQYCTGNATDPSVNGLGTNPVASGETCAFWTAPVKDQPSRLGIDVSQFEGISLWARRGPGGAAALRVAVLDSNTAPESALAAEQQGKAPACKRVVQCCQKCVSLPHAYLDAGVDGTEPLTLGMETDMRCYVEGEDMPPFLPSDTDAGAFVFKPACPKDPASPWEAYDDSRAQDAKGVWDAWNRDHKPCCPKTTAEDPKYGGDEEGECASYVFKYDFSSGYYCQRANEKLPEKDDNRCEDAFEAPIVIDTEWKLFFIPWSELRRSTLGRPPIDPRAIWTIRLYPGAGWLDTYVDDIGFYRTRK